MSVGRKRLCYAILLFHGTLYASLMAMAPILLVSAPIGHAFADAFHRSNPKGGFLRLAGCERKPREWHPGAWPCQHWRLDGGGDLAHAHASYHHFPFGLHRSRVFTSGDELAGWVSNPF